MCSKSESKEGTTAGKQGHRHAKTGQKKAKDEIETITC